jgi:sulfate/thiosulfate-binding protein
MSVGPGRRAVRARVVLAIAVCALLAVVGAAQGASKLSLVAYSTPQEAYEALIPAFTSTPAGKGVSFSQSYGASGDQSRAVANGLPADVVAFSLAPDIDRLVQSGQVSPTWDQGPYKGIVTRSVVVFTVRKGNPKKIKTWTDLLKPGVDVLIPNWQTSGGAKWDVIAAYGAQRKAGRSDDEAKQYLRDLYKHVSVQDKSAREALDTFAGGKGDVLIGYENEAIYAQQHGISADYVIPKNTILIENPIAAVQTSSNLKAAKAFVNFSWTARAQALYASKGYRPVLPALIRNKAIQKKYPRPAGLFTINVVGGWNLANKVFFDPANGVAAKAQRGQ